MASLSNQKSVYMDNILIASSNIEEQYMQFLTSNGLFIKPEKCIWEAPNYLGLILKKGVTCMNPAKVKGVANWPIPSSVKQV
jgi:hypothetical protein